MPKLLVDGATIAVSLALEADGEFDRHRDLDPTGVVRA
jgi:hypothetical protein